MFNNDFKKDKFVSGIRNITRISVGNIRRIELLSSFNLVEFRILVIGQKYSPNLMVL